MTSRTLFALLLSLTLLLGCESRQEAETTVKAPVVVKAPAEVKVQARLELPTYDLLREPLEPVLVETANEALPLWRDSQASQPVLVLLSNDPYLKPIPQELQKDTIDLIKKGTTTDLTAKTKPSLPAPLLLPQMTLSAAMESYLFSRVVWVVSGDESFKQQTAANFAKHLLNYGAISEAEALNFNPSDQGFNGLVRGLPFSAVHETSLPTISEPVRLHIDLSYFKPLYKGEIKTPLYQLLYQTLERLRAANWSAEAVSISLSNLEGNLPLSTRFVGSNLAKLFFEPEGLEAPLPDNWETRRNALYLENFFQKEKVYELYQQLKNNDPEDASASYALYRTLREMKKGTEALEMLAEAVRLEPAYGMEYLTLANTALEKKRPDQSLKMLDLATAAFPDNPFIQLQKAELLLNLEHPETAVPLLEELSQQPWSKVYYPQLPDYIRSLQSSSLAPKD